MKKSCIYGVAAAMLVMLQLAPVNAATIPISSSINPEEKLVIDFVFSNPPTSNIGAVDFFQFNFSGSFTDFFGSGFVTANLYDGISLLGTRVFTSGQSCCTFVQSGSPGTDLATVNIDMTSIQNGTVEGRFELIPTFDNPTVNSNVSVGWSLRTGTFVGPGSYWEGSPDPIILNSQVTAVPIPATIWLMVPALFGLFGITIRR